MANQLDLFSGNAVSHGVPRHSSIGSRVSRCHQWAIREHLARTSSRVQMASLDGCHVRQIDAEHAKPIIRAYEWLGTMGRSVICTGLLSRDNEILGVACFGWPGSPESRNICGRDLAHLAICLERGACVHWAPKNAASFLIARSCQLVAQDHNYRIFYAYADEDAGEIGTVYQACNWLYIGQGVGRTPGRLREYFIDPAGHVVSSRSLRHRRITKSDAIRQGWQVIYQHPKHKYIFLEGDRREQKQLREMLRYPVLPYPKRSPAVAPPIRPAEDADDPWRTTG